MIKEKVAEAVKRTEHEGEGKYLFKVRRYAKKRLTSKEVSDTGIIETPTNLKINCINDSNKKSTTNLTNDSAKKYKRWKTEALLYKCRPTGKQEMIC